MAINHSTSELLENHRWSGTIAAIATIPIAILGEWASRRAHRLGHDWHGASRWVFRIGVFAIAGLVCIPVWGTMGAVMVFAVSNAIYLIMTYLYSRFALHVPYESLGRLLVLSVLGFATASIITVIFQGFALYAAASLLLLGLIAAEWMWISDSTERERLWRGGVSFVAGWR